MENGVDECDQKLTSLCMATADGNTRSHLFGRGKYQFYNQFAAST